MIQQRQVGEVMIYALIETDAWSVIQSIIHQATEDAIQQMDRLSPSYADSDWKFFAVVQSFLIQTPARTLLVDTCVWDNIEIAECPEWSNMQNNFLKKIETICPIDEIDGVLCTHLHFDHIWWNTIFIEWKWIPTFPNATYFVSHDEYAYRSSIPSAEAEDDHAAFARGVLPLIDAWCVALISSDHRISDEISFIPTPGHTPDHVSIRIRSQGEQAIITGDVMHHPCQIAHPDRWTVVDTLPEQARDTRTEMINANIWTDMLVIWSHFAAPSWGYIRGQWGSSIFTTDK